MEGRGFRIAEEPLRRWILEAYQEGKRAGGAAEKVLSAIRQYLSGPPGSDYGPYWFEDDPEGATRQLLEELDAAVPGLARSACKPILEKLRAAHASTRGETLQEPDVPALARGIAGPGEPLACAVVSTLLLGLSRIGLESLERALERNP
jgi:hypothetical protein